MRKAAYLATIAAIEPIEGKDRIKYITLKDLGWQVIGSSELYVGQRVIYIEYDTIISENQPWAEFLRKRCYAPKYKGFKISAMKMAGKISYGLVLTPEEAGVSELSIVHAQDGFDFSEILNVSTIDDAAEFDVKQKVTTKPMTKWQRFVKKYAYFIWKFFYYRKPEKNDFPSAVAIKTDETRIQNLSYLFERHRGIPLYVTEKIDGQSATFSLYKNKFIISSRNVKQYEEYYRKAIKELTPGNAMNLGKGNDFIHIACAYGLPKKMYDWLRIAQLDGITIQGELAGPGIQKNKLRLNNNVLYIFNMFDPKNRQYFKWSSIETFSTFSGIPHVPFKEYTTFKWNNISEIEEYVKENFVGTLYPVGQPREGLVFRKMPEDLSPYLPVAEHNMTGCFSFKVINPDFILNE